MRNTETIDWIFLVIGILMLVYVLMVAIRISQLQLLFLRWNTKLATWMKATVHVEDEKSKQYYQQFYLTNVNAYCLRFWPWKEKDFIEDPLLHHDVNEYHERNTDKGE